MEEINQRRDEAKTCLRKFATREFPMHGKNYDENVYDFLVDACNYLRGQKFTGELGNQAYIKDPLKYMRKCEFISAVR